QTEQQTGRLSKKAAKRWAMRWAIAGLALTVAVHASTSSSIFATPTLEVIPASDTAKTNDVFGPEIVDVDVEPYTASLVSTPTHSADYLASNFIQVMYDVPLIAQQTADSCWAAGAAKLVSWRDNVTYAPWNIAEATDHEIEYNHTGLPADDDSIFPMFGMVTEPAQSYSVSAFADMLSTHGPLWVASDESLSSASSSPHIRVVTGIRGDGTPDGTYVYINDPWERGMNSFRTSNRGSQYYETYAQFMRKQADLGYRESDVQGIYVAHLR
ncbi:MAG: papain-like cysteine protease family protein, partial [Cyanobacteria bacterium J06576_12]